MDWEHENRKSETMVPWCTDSWVPVVFSSSIAGNKEYIYIDSSLSTNRRKFRSQTSDNMDRWKVEQGRGREKRKIVIHFMD
jgi:hypothetical protein